MCFFLLLGVTPRERVAGRELRTCSYCGRETMHSIIERRMWFNLFFIPVFPVSGVQVYAVCEDCSRTADDTEAAVPESPAYLAPASWVCPHCGARAEGTANFCPNCGRRLGEAEGQTMP